MCIRDRLIAVLPAARAWRKMLSAVVEHDADGEQSLTSPDSNAPVTWPPYWVRLFWDELVSVHDEKYEHDRASECRYGIELKPAPPTPDQVRFSNENTTTL